MPFIWTKNEMIFDLTFRWRFANEIFLKFNWNEFLLVWKWQSRSSLIEYRKWHQSPQSQIAFLFWLKIIASIILFRDTKKVSWNAAQFNIVQKRLQTSILQFRNERFSVKFAQLLSRLQTVLQIKKQPDKKIVQFEENINISIWYNEASTAFWDEHESS